MDINKKNLISADQKIGIESRVDMEEFLLCKIFLDLRVKIDSSWLRTRDKVFNFSNI